MHIICFGVNLYIRWTLELENHIFSPPIKIHIDNASCVFFFAWKSGLLYSFILLVSFLYKVQCPFRMMHAYEIQNTCVCSYRIHFNLVSILSFFLIFPFMLLEKIKMLFIIKVWSVRCLTSKSSKCIAWSHACLMLCILINCIWSIDWTDSSDTFELQIQIHFILLAGNYIICRHFLCQWSECAIYLFAEELLFLLSYGRKLEHLLNKMC